MAKYAFQQGWKVVAATGLSLAFVYVSLFYGCGQSSNTGTKEETPTVSSSARTNSSSPTGQTPTPQPSSNKRKFRAVDPEIKDAVFCIDVDNNNECNVPPNATPYSETGTSEAAPIQTGFAAGNDILSSRTDKDGYFVFPQDPQEGQQIIPADLSSATHDNMPFSKIEIPTANGTPKPEDIKGVLLATKVQKLPDNASSDYVDNLTPLTTLLASGWTEQNVIDELTAAGLTGDAAITREMLYANPMENVRNIDTTTENADKFLGKLQATLAIQAFVNILAAVNAKAQQESQGKFRLTYELFQKGGPSEKGEQWSKDKLKEMVSILKASLSKNMLQNVETQLENANNQVKAAGNYPGMQACLQGLPPVKGSVIVKSSLSVLNFVLGKVIESYPNLNYMPPTQKVSEWGINVGKSYYFLENRTNACINTLFTQQMASSMIQTVIPETFNDIKENKCLRIRLKDENGTIECVK